MILGLDVSSSRTGWSVIDFDGNLVDYGDIKTSPRKKYPHNNDIAYKALKELKKIKKKYDITDIFVEERFLGFAGGKSTASTIVKVASVNALYIFILQDLFDIVPVEVHVSTARSKLDISIPKGLDKRESKQFVIDHVQSLYPLFEYELTSYGNFKPGTDDIADSIVIATYGLRFGKEET